MGQKINGIYGIEEKREERRNKRRVEERKEENKRGDRKQREEREEVYLVPVPASVGASCRMELGMKKVRWSRWKEKRQVEGGCGETETA